MIKEPPPLGWKVSYLISQEQVMILEKLIREETFALQDYYDVSKLSASHACIAIMSLADEGGIITFDDDRNVCLAVR